ncbi:MAG: WecB/TagA/CpsF family glycosyltransferase [Chloroflexi bacterium]|nr:WecB/TagA/CpsF family glycosyltransferase [Chloroflexota bacterium]
MRSVFLLGVRVDDVTYDEAVQAIDRFVNEGGPHVVTTPNPEFVMLAQRDPQFRAVLNQAALSIPDGVGLLLGARLLGQPLREHVRGTDLVYRVAEWCAQTGHRLFLLGAAEGVAPAAAWALQARFPGLQVAGAFAGSPRVEDEPRVRAAIAAAAPVHVLLVAYGAPAQEQWLARNLELLGVPVGMGVGGVFNFLAGRSARAPAWMRRLELEWLHRLATEPWRWRRQLALPRFALAMLREAALVALRARARRGYNES